MAQLKTSVLCIRAAEQFPDTLFARNNLAHLRGGLRMNIQAMDIEDYQETNIKLTDIC